MGFGVKFEKGGKITTGG
jgi:hypothetical protein